tara:strand:+ start:693 stop:884 length:192 start_codon:yes stop_codon:yes gene_type:complete
MKLSNQGMGTLMMCLQKSLMEQSDIMPMLQELNFELEGEEIVCTNPPTVEINNIEFDEDFSEE